MRKFTATALFVALAACGQADNDPGPGGVTVGEARALDEAAAMLEEQRLPENTDAHSAERSEEPAETDARQ